MKTSEPILAIVAASEAPSADSGKFSPGALMAGSKTVSGFWLSHCFTKPELFHNVIAELFGLIAAGTIRPVIGSRFALSEAITAHEHMRSRGSTGKITLDPLR